jgi:steroid delta-isomerase-like uncharacterized protein
MSRPTARQVFLREAFMPITSNTFMQRFVEFINTADEALGNELIANNALFYVPNQSEPLQGVPGYLAIIGMMRSGFPDIQWKLEEMIVEEHEHGGGDTRIAARFTMRGTHQGVFFGVPATDKSIAVQAVNFYRVAHSKIVEERGQPDLLSLMQQIGAAPVS